MATVRAAVLLAALAALATACLGPTSPVPVRWFVPPLPIAESAAPEGPPVELGRIEPPPYVGQGFVWRLSDVEIAVDDVHRWSDEPTAIVRRALERALLDSGRFAESAGARRLDVRLEAFEAVIDGDPRARVAGELTLRGRNGSGLVRTRIDVAERLPGDTAEEVARGMGVALGRFAEQAADWLAAQ